jgi:hypothetical protein
LNFFPAVHLDNDLRYIPRFSPRRGGKSYGWRVNSTCRAMIAAFRRSDED